MTNFEKLMLETAREVLRKTDDKLWMLLCNAGNLPCSRCPAQKKCNELKKNEEAEAWLRQEAEE